MKDNLTRKTLSAGTLIGDKVINRQNQEVGTLKEIMLDPDSGRIAYAVVSSGGFLGIGDKLFAVPWRAIEINTSKHAVVFDVDKERLEQAPGFDKDSWPDMSDPTWERRVHDYYKTQPYWQ